MYKEYFGLSEKPFSLTSDPSFLYRSSVHDPALRALLLGVREKMGIMTLVGPVGTGKTTLCHRLIDELADEAHISFLINPIFDPLDLLKAINHDFGISSQGSRQELMNALNAFLLEATSADLNNLVIVDEAQNLTSSALESLRLLSNLETHKNKILQILLVGQPQLQMKLESPELLQLNQRIALRESLRPLPRDESCGYVIHRLEKANGLGKIVFDDYVLSSIHTYSQGYPRMINLICDRILLGLYVRGDKHITKKLVKLAFNELKENKIQTSPMETEPWIF